MAKNAFGDEIVEEGPAVNAFGDPILSDADAPYARRPAQKPAAQLGMEAMSGDPAAIQAYNLRARSLGQPTWEEERAANSPVAGQSFGQNAWQAWGRILPNLARNFDSPEQVNEARRLDEPLLGTGGGVTGTLAGNLALYAGPQSAATRGLAVAGRVAPYIAGGGVGAIAGAAEPVGIGESRAGNAGRAALWGVGGQAASDVIGAGARALTPTMTRETANLLDDAAGYGIKPNIGQVSQNKMTQQVWNQFGRLPLSGQGARDEANRLAFNRAVSKGYGEAVDKLTPEAHAKAMNALGNGFNVIRAQTNVPVDPAFIGRLQSVRQQIAQEAGEDAAKLADGWIQKLINNSKNGQISGTEYQAWSSSMAKLKATGKDAYGLSLVREAVDETVDSNIPQKLRGQWQELRRQWAIGKTVEPLVAKGAGSGDIPPAQLLGRVTADGAGKARVARGKGGEIADLANIGQRFLKEPPDSGTAGRLGALMAVARNPYAQAAGLGATAYGAEQQGLVTPGQLGWLATALVANRGLMKAGASPAVIRGVPQRAIASTAQKILPRAAIPYALTTAPVAAEEKKKPKRP